MLSILLILTAFTLACGKGSRPLNLALDVYLHPEAGSSDDILLQTAIRKNLAASETTARGVYVRVLDLHVVLSGTVESAASRDEAIRIAKATKVVINDGTSISPSEVKSMIQVEK